MKRVSRWLKWSVLGLIGLFLVWQLWLLGWVLLWGWVNPGETRFMEIRLAELRQKVPNAQLKQQWVPYERISIHLKRAIIAAEDNFLRGKFGPGFDAYCRDVPRWLPRLSGLGKTLSSGTFKWRRVIVKEYGTPFGWVVGICAVLLWNLSRLEGGLVRHLADATTVGLVFVVALVLYTLARTLKKMRILVAD